MLRFWVLYLLGMAVIALAVYWLWGLNGLISFLIFVMVHVAWMHRQSR